MTTAFQKKQDVQLLILKVKIPNMFSITSSSVNNCRETYMFWNIQRNSYLGEMYAIMCRFDPDFEFLTMGFDDVNSPQVFHLSFIQPYLS